MFIALLFLLFSYIPVHAMDKPEITCLDCDQMLQLLTRMNALHTQLETEYEQNMQLLFACNFKTESTQYEQEEKILIERMNNLQTRLEPYNLSFKLGENPKLFILNLLAQLNNSCEELTTQYTNTIQLWFHCKRASECTRLEGNLEEIEMNINKKRAQFAKKHNLNLNGFVVGTEPNAYIDALHIID